MKVKRLLAWTGSLLLGTVILATVAGLTFRVALGPVVQDSNSDAVYAPHGVVATSQPLTSQAGLNVLERGTRPRQ